MTSYHRMHTTFRLTIKTWMIRRRVHWFYSLVVEFDKFSIRKVDGIIGHYVTGNDFEQYC